MRHLTSTKAEGGMSLPSVVACDDFYPPGGATSGAPSRSDQVKAASAEGLRPPDRQRLHPLPGRRRLLRAHNGRPQRCRLGAVIPAICARGHGASTTCLAMSGPVHRRSCWRSVIRTRHRRRVAGSPSIRWAADAWDDGRCRWCTHRRRPPMAREPPARVTRRPSARPSSG